MLQYDELKFTGANTIDNITSSAHRTPHPLITLLHGLRKDSFFLILLAALVLLSFIAPGKIGSYPTLVDWPTIAALTGLLALTKGLEVSGIMHRLGHQLIGFMATERSTALCLVMTAALLSTVLTNDVALFVVVPLTLGVCRIANMPATRLIVFEALAVNAGSALTPIGNPQNLFLWQLAKVSFGEFVVHMLPLVAMLMIALLVLTVCVFRKQPIQVSDQEQQAPLDRTLLFVSLALYLPFLLATNMHHADWAVIVVLAILLVLRPPVLLQLDWGLLLIFILMFIDLRLFASLNFVRECMHSLGLEQASHLYLTGIAASQIISNVPAAIALAEYSDNWRVIAYGVNVGGFGFMIGSLANLIALRMTGDRKAWLSFHLYAIPSLGIAAALGYALLFLGHVL
ncbi:SLC13 family permease [Glaciimonas soli]|uniref:Anion transporter n=1 Tax=Glaciimonas soli TaxID=2590999 RepID=A0A843YS99_9BURK|nr:SLC13 family permease [Glaciimonas soli]MQR02445.1 anion transporter [Glaciimonas soli]